MDTATLAAAALANTTPVTVLQTPVQTIDELKAELAALKSKLEAGTPPKAPTTPMTLEEAKALVKSFEGKRGRRPADFYAAEKQIKASLTPEDLEAAKNAAKLEKNKAKEAKNAAKEAKKLEREYDALVAEAAAATKVTDKVTKEFLKVSAKSEALAAKVKAHPLFAMPTTPAAE